MEIILLIIVLIAMAGTGAVGVWFGKKLGTAIERADWKKEWKRLKALPAPGQEVWVNGVGDLHITGRGVNEVGEDIVFYIPVQLLGERHPIQIEDEEFERIEASMPLDTFVLNADFVRAAKYQV